MGISTEGAFRILRNESKIVLNIRVLIWMT